MCVWKGVGGDGEGGGEGEIGRSIYSEVPKQGLNILHANASQVRTHVDTHLTD
jgi:hypothetical protein